MKIPNLVDKLNQLIEYSASSAMTPYKFALSKRWSIKGMRAEK